MGNIVKPKLGYNKKALTNVCKCFCFEGGPSWARTNVPSDYESDALTS